MRIFGIIGLMLTLLVGAYIAMRQNKSMSAIGAKHGKGRPPPGPDEIDTITTDAQLKDLQKKLKKMADEYPAVKDE